MQLRNLSLQFSSENCKIHPDAAGVVTPITMDTYIHIHTYHSRFIPEGVVEVSQIFLRDTHVLPTLFSYEEHCKRDRW
jgi:hypothetical protein